MGLRVWLCDVIKALPVLFKTLTEVDYYPLCTFFGQLLNTKLADLAVQLLMRVCDNLPREARREQAEIFRWLIETAGLRDLFVLLMSSRPGRELGRLSVASDLDSGIPRESGAAGVLVVRGGEASPQKETNAGGVPEATSGETAPAALPNAETAAAAPTDDQASVSVVVHPPTTSSKNLPPALRGPLAALEHSRIAREHSSTSFLPVLRPLLESPDLQLARETVANLIFGCSRDALVPLLGKYLPETLEGAVEVELQVPVVLESLVWCWLRRPDCVEAL